MPKKDFKNNPALQFISTATEPDEYEPNSFTDTVRQPKPRSYTAPANEIKSRRVQLLIQPSLWKELERIASREGISNNEAVITAIRAYVEREG